jgi:hypothetical protein
MQALLQTICSVLHSYTDEVAYLGLTLQYVGNASYVEFDVNGSLVGFARGMTRDDLPESWIKDRILPSIEAGTKCWVVSGLDAVDEKSKAMKNVVEEPAEIVEESTETETDYSSLTRAKLMALCKERGIAVSNKDKKADLLKKLEE